jgi:predicted Zn-dependent protease
MTSPKPTPRNRLRLWWLIALLLFCLNLMILQRRPIAQGVAKQALTLASQDKTDRAWSYIHAADWIWPGTAESAIASARIHRRSGDMGEFGRSLRLARFEGIEKDRADREETLAEAQMGQMKTAGPKMVDLLEKAGKEAGEICEAYAKGYMRIRDFNSAISLLEGWANEIPNDARPYAWIGQIQAELQASEPAETAFRKALSIDPANAQAALGLGQLMVDLKKPAESIPFFKIALASKSLGPAAAVGLAGSLQAESRIEEAVQVLNQASERFPNDYRLLVEKANLDIEQGRYAEAEELLRDDVKSGSKRREIRYAYALALRGLGKVEDSVPHFEYAAEAAKETSTANRKVREVADQPDNLQLRYEIGAAHLRYGNTEDGMMWLQSVLNIDPKHQPTHLALAEYYETQVRQNTKAIGLAQQHRIWGGPSPRAEAASANPKPADSPSDAPKPETETNSTKTSQPPK